MRKAVAVRELAAQLAGMSAPATAMTGPARARITSSGAEDGDALPLAAGQPGRVGVAPVPDLERVDELAGAQPRLAALRPGELVPGGHRA